MRQRKRRDKEGMERVRKGEKITGKRHKRDTDNMRIHRET